LRHEKKSSGHYIYVSKDMRIGDYFSKPKGVLEQKRLGNSALSMYSGDTPFTSGLGSRIF
jgi:hypothetical protein